VSSKKQEARCKNKVLSTKYKVLIFSFILFFPFIHSYSQIKTNIPMAQDLDTTTFGAGCFWCVESIFQNVTGVESVTSGYMGGHIENPTYEDVCTGKSGHAEVCKIIYDKNKVSYPELLEIFWSTHDPTTLNRQGSDAGTQYRSVIFYHTDEQKKYAQEYKKKIDTSGMYDRPIVTEISPADKFYPAEKYHQNYYNLNRDKPYCTFVIRPKLDKFHNLFPSKVKK
jgi:peptide-methionine (S)-S-oxide reductase